MVLDSWFRWETDLQSSIYMRFTIHSSRLPVGQPKRDSPNQKLRSSFEMGFRDTVTSFSDSLIPIRRYREKDTGVSSSLERFGDFGSHRSFWCDRWLWTKEEPKVFTCRLWSQQLVNWPSISKQMTGCSLAKSTEIQRRGFTPPLRWFGDAAFVDRLIA
jgi:hypothetical protein